MGMGANGMWKTVGSSCSITFPFVFLRVRESKFARRVKIGVDPSNR